MYSALRTKQKRHVIYKKSIKEFRKQAPKFFRSTNCERVLQDSQAAPPVGNNNNNNGPRKKLWYPVESRYNKSKQALNKKHQFN